jgi:hypothetical protein
MMPSSRGAEMNTFKRDYLSVIVAVFAAFVVSAIWYSPLLFGKHWIALLSEYMHVTPNPHIVPWKPLMELALEAVAAYVLLRFVQEQAMDRLTSALSLGFWIWLGFPVTMMVGASLWNNMLWALSLIHAGDWFMKMLVMAAAVQWLPCQPQ